MSIGKSTKCKQHGQDWCDMLLTATMTFRDYFKDIFFSSNLDNHETYYIHTNTILFGHHYYILLLTSKMSMLPTAIQKASTVAWSSQSYPRFDYCSCFFSLLYMENWKSWYILLPFSGIQCPSPVMSHFSVPVSWSDPYPIKFTLIWYKRTVSWR